MAARGNPELLPIGQFPRKGATRAPGDDLYEAYNASAEWMRSILELVTDRAVGFCPYCCMKLVRKPMGRSHDRDHVLPRSKYPEFSILSVNLVVGCDGCNDGKWTKCLDSQGNWLFVHPYFDDFLKTNVVTANVVGEGVVVFSLKVDHLRRADADRLARHADTLDLLERMTDYASLHVTILQGTLSRLETRGVPEALREAAAGVLAIRPNDPLGLACKALAETL